MSDARRSPLYGVAVYNPDLLSKEELISHFVARRPLLERILEDLRREGTVQHRLLIGPRGMGKTTLLRRLRYAIEDDPILQRRWLPLSFPEEQYNVVRLSDLYLNCIDALGDTLEEMGRHAEAEALDEAVETLPDQNEKERAARALEVLLGTARRLDRRLVLLIDNIELIFDRLKEHQWTLRELLSTEERILFVGASASMHESTYKYKEAFYDFFLIHDLKGLNEEEMREVVRNLARMGRTPSVERLLDEDRARFKTLHVLSGGNPRTVVLLYSVLAQSTEGDVRSDLERLLDQCTPLYKARFEALPAQMQQIVDAMALHWDPLSAAELAALVRLETKAVSAQLSRLVEQGVVEKVEYHPAGKLGYQVAERFFNIWYLMRASRRVRRRLVWLVEFLKLFYGNEQLGSQAQRHLRGAPGEDAKSRLRHAEYSLALAEAMEEAPLKCALESTAMHVLAIDRELRVQISQIIDLEGADASLKPLVDRHRMAAEIQEKIASAKVEWEGWDAKRFGDLLGGSLLLKLEVKLQIAEGLEKLSRHQIDGFTSIFLVEIDLWHRCFSGEELDQLRLAFRLGYMIGWKDIRGADAAALALDAPGLRAIALASSFEKEFDAQKFDTLKETLPACRSPFAWHVYGRLLRDEVKQYPEAEIAYRKATELNPSYSRSWLVLAKLRYQLGKVDDETESTARKAVELDSNDHEALLIFALILVDRGKWNETEPLARRFLGEGSPDFHEKTWHVQIFFFGEAVRTGHAADALKLLDELGLGERWRPLREALAAIVAGTRAYLRRVAPEVRHPAEQLIDQLGAENLAN